MTSLPFTFYCKPYLATTIRNYDPVEFYTRLIDLFLHMTSFRQEIRAVYHSRSWIFKGYHPIRNTSIRLMIRELRKILVQLKTDPEFLAFHEGRNDVLPEFYHHRYEALLGKYQSLVTRQDRIPVHELPDFRRTELKKTGS